jgi:hypothetical protein
MVKYQQSAILVVVGIVLFYSSSQVECKFNAKKIFQRFETLLDKKVANVKFSFDNCGKNTLFTRPYLSGFRLFFI